MFELVKEKKIKDYFVKMYKSNESIDKALDIIVNSDIPFKYVYVSENADVGLKMCSGEYSFVSFMENYDKITDYADSYHFALKEKKAFIDVDMEHSSIFLFSDDKEDDLNNMISMSKGESK